MLEFYEFNTLNISIVLISTFIIYYLLIKYFKNSKDLEKDNNSDNSFSLEYLIISIIVSLGLSIIISYVMSSYDENILTDNFWDPIKDTV